MIMILLCIQIVYFGYKCKRSCTSGLWLTCFKMALQTWIVPSSCCKTGNTQQCYSEARNLGPVYTELRSLVSQHACYTPRKVICMMCHWTRWWVLMRLSLSHFTSDLFTELLWQDYWLPLWKRGYFDLGGSGRGSHRGGCGHQKMTNINTMSNAKRDIMYMCIYEFVLKTDVIDYGKM